MPENKKPIYSIDENFEIRKGLTSHDNSALAAMRITPINSSKSSIKSNSNKNNNK